MAELHLEIEASDGVPRVVLRGDLDLSTAVAFQRGLLAVEADRPPVLVIDLRAVAFLDSVGVAQLVSAHRRARRDHRRVVFVRGAGTVEQVLRVTRLGHVLEVVGEVP